MGVITGRVEGLTPEQLTRVTIEIDSAGRAGIHRLRPDRAGRFVSPALPDERPVRVVVRSTDASRPLATLPLEDAGDREVAIGVGALRGTPTTRLRQAEAAVADRDEAEAGRQDLLVTEVERLRRRRGAAREVGRLVLRDLRAHAPGAGEREWVADSPDEILALRARAAEETLDGFGARSLRVRAPADRLAVDDRLPATTLAQAVTGQTVGTQGLVRRDLRSRLDAQTANRGLDGLPAPPDGRDFPDSGRRRASRPPDERDGTVEGRLAALVDAIRLPEDPPLLTAPSAVGADGEPATLRGGPAQVEALHDFHELRIAMPDVWQLRAEPQLVEAVEGVAEELADAGIDVERIVQRAQDGTRLHTLVDLADAYRTALEETPVRAVARRQHPYQPKPGRGLLDHSDIVVLDPIDPYDEPPPVEPDDDGDGETQPDGVRPSACDQKATARPPTLLEQLRSHLGGGHPFTVFAANGSVRAVNFGLLITWRQRWNPVTYQTGDIVHTMTLAPGETRKIVTRTRRVAKRHTAEADKSQRHRSSETASTARAETEILRKAEATTNFQLSSEGSTNLLVSGGAFATTGSRGTSDGGSDARRRFREAVTKAVQEYREEHSVEVTRDDELSEETETTAELTNPNNELAMTAVLYELSRRYRISERLHRARPVVLVAMPVPAPGDITAAWLIRHDWILRRSLLDDSFRATLEYLSASYLGDKHALAQLVRAEATQRDVLTRTEQLVAATRAAARDRAGYLEKLRKDLAQGDERNLLDTLPGVKLAKDAVSWVGGLLGNDEDADEDRRHQLLLEAAEEALARADREAEEASTRLGTAVSAYQEAARELAQAQARAANADVAIARLRLHVRDNLLHYLHAIWAHEPPDQRYFELHDVQIPVLDGQVTVTGKLPGDGGVVGLTTEEFEATFTRDGGTLTFRSLAEVADLDELLGFKGNYALFPLREQNAVTSLLLGPLLDGDEILVDPTDPGANWTLTELRVYAARLRAQVAEGALTPEEFESVHAPWLRATLERLLSDPNPPEEELVVPSGSLYMELLTSGSSLLEPFTLEHRALDVANVRAEVREAELENLRRAARLMAGALDDPDMDDFERHLVQSDGAGGAPPP